MRHINQSIQSFYIIKLMKSRRKPSMQAKYLSIHHGRQWLACENFSELFPDSFIAVFLEALIIKPVDFVDLIAFMIAS